LGHDFLEGKNIKSVHVSKKNSSHEKSRFFRPCFTDAHVRSTRQIKSLEGWNGHVWQARFDSSILDEKYLLAAVGYVERNPFRAGLALKPC